MYCDSSAFWLEIHQIHESDEAQSYNDLNRIKKRGGGYWPCISLEWFQRHLERFPDHVIVIISTSNANGMKQKDEMTRKRNTFLYNNLVHTHRLSSYWDRHTQTEEYTVRKQHFELQVTKSKKQKIKTEHRCQRCTTAKKNLQSCSNFLYELGDWQ